MSPTVDMIIDLSVMYWTVLYRGDFKGNFWFNLVSQQHTQRCRGNCVVVVEFNWEALMCEGNYPCLFLKKFKVVLFQQFICTWNTHTSSDLCQHPVIKVIIVLKLVSKISQGPFSEKSNGEFENLSYKQACGQGMEMAVLVMIKKRWLLCIRWINRLLIHLSFFHPFFQTSLFPSGFRPTQRHVHILWRSSI